MIMMGRVCVLCSGSFEQYDNEWDYICNSQAIDIEQLDLNRQHMFNCSLSLSLCAMANTDK